MAHVRKGDNVVVISGAHKGKRGKILRVVGERVVIEKVAMVKRHQKPSQKNAQGGIIEKEGSVHISNVALFDEKTNRGTRTKVVNEWGATHDVPNLFIMDASTFPTSGATNPTATIMAVALRNTHHLIAERRNQKAA